MATELTLDAFFAGAPTSRRLFETLATAVAAAGPATMRVTKSQIAWKRRRGFAWAWMPSRYLKREAAPLVLSVSLPWRDQSSRWKQIVEPRPGQLMHHLELYQLADVDAPVREWLKQAWQAAA
jgi:hypothetical protein